MSQAHVLPAFANSKRELIVRHDHLHRMLILIDYHLRDLGRRQCPTYQFSLIVSPWNDIDLLAAQLLDYRLDSGAFHADAGAHRIDIGVLGVNRDFRASARLPRTLPTFAHPL